MPEVTVGIDIGTTSVKALAVDGDGRVLARSRQRHPVRSPAPDRFEHDAELAWRRNVLAAYDEVRHGHDVGGVCVAAMVPSLCAVDDGGHPITPGLLYGDGRGGEVTGENPSESGELVGFLRWCAEAAPGAAGYWPAQAVANHALTGVGGIDTVTAMTTLPLFDFTGWDAAVAAEAGATTDQLPVIIPGSDPVGRTPDGVPVSGGTIDAFGEQLVAGATEVGDVLVILGTTLIVWAVVPDWIEVPGLWTVPHTVPGLTLVGGASNAGGLFLNWALGLTGSPPGDGVPGDGPPGAPSGPGDGSPPGEAETAHPENVPVWTPYLRGERVPLHDPHRRAALHDLHIATDRAGVRRAAYEASGFVVRHQLDLAGLSPRRIVATGGGVRVGSWVQGLADTTGLPVDVVAVPEGGAYGAAYLARVTAGFEAGAADAGRWAGTDHRVQPHPDWVEPASSRYQRFRELTGPVPSRPDR